MYVSNLTNAKLGLSGSVVLRAREINRYIDDNDKALVESTLRAKAANLVSIVREQGLIKTIPANAVKTLTVDVGGIGTSPRSSSKRVKEFLEKSENKNEQQNTEVETIKDQEKADNTQDNVEQDKVSKKTKKK